MPPWGWDVWLPGAVGALARGPGALRDPEQSLLWICCLRRLERLGHWPGACPRQGAGMPVAGRPLQALMPRMCVAVGAARAGPGCSAWGPSRGWPWL